MHPTAMYRRGDTHGRVEVNEIFRYVCPKDGESYEYQGQDEELYLSQIVAANNILLHSRD